MRVSLDATPLLGQPTGVGKFASCLIDALARRDDLEVDAYAVSLRGRAELAERLPAGVVGRTRPFPATALLRAWQRSEVPPAEWWTEGADVVHGTNFVVPPTRAAAMVVTVHDLTSVRFPELCNRTALHYPALVTKAVERGAFVHTPSAFVAREVMELLAVPAERVRAVHSGVPPVADRTDGPPPVEGRYVLFLGTVEPRKGLPELVRAFDLVAGDDDDVRLVLAGPAGWGTDALSSARTASRHASRVVWFGYVDDARRAALLRHASAFVFPSRYEGFGFPVLEAMAADVPVVTTDAGALPEIVGSAASVVPAGDVEALAAAIVAVLGDAGHRARLVAAGRHRVGEFGWDRCAEGVTALYRDAVAARS